MPNVLMRNVSPPTDGPPPGIHSPRNPDCQRVVPALDVYQCLLFVVVFLKHSGSDPNGTGGETRRIGPEAAQVPKPDGGSRDEELGRSGICGGGSSIVR